jgi:hypothetical protein
VEYATFIKLIPEVELPRELKQNEKMQGESVEAVKQDEEMKRYKSEALIPSGPGK